MRFIGRPGFAGNEPHGRLCVGTGRWVCGSVDTAVTVREHPLAKLWPRRCTHFSYDVATPPVTAFALRGMPQIM